MSRKSRFARLLRRLAPPRFPDYEEYRGEEPEIDLAGVARPAEAPPAATEDETAVKVRRLRILSSFIVVISVLGFTYFYLTNDSAISRRTRSRELVAAEMMDELAPPEDRERGETLEDIRRWTEEIEARAAREVDRSETLVRTPRGTIAENLPPSAPSPWGSTPAGYYDSLATTETYSWSAGLDWETSAAIIPSGPAPPRPSDGVGVAPTAPPAPASPPPRVTADSETGYSPYRRRDLSPVVIEPRTTDPY